jgi:hypothetical protein
VALGAAWVYFLALLGLFRLGGSILQVNPLIMAQSSIATMMVRGLSISCLDCCCVAFDDVMIYLEVSGEATLEEPYHRW